MNKKVIATIGLARGYMAFFDPISKIMLDYSRPYAQVYEGTDTSGLKKALWNTIILVSGDLDGNNIEESNKKDSKVHVVDSDEVVTRNDEVKETEVATENKEIEQESENAQDEVKADDVKIEDKKQKKARQKK